MDKNCAELLEVVKQLKHHVANLCHAVQHLEQVSSELARMADLAIRNSKILKLVKSDGAK